MPVSPKKDCRDNRGDQCGRGWNEEAKAPPRLPDGSFDARGKHDTLEPGTLEESPAETVIGPRLCCIHEFTNRAHRKRHARANESAEFLFRFLAFNAILGVYAQLHEFLIRQESACFQSGQFLEMGMITHGR